MSGETLFVEGEELTPPPPEIDPSQRDWPVAEADTWIERADLGAGVSTFYSAGSAIPPALASLPRHDAAPDPVEVPKAVKRH